MKFAWRKDKRDKVMNGISKYNKRLEDMVKRTSHTPNQFTPSPQHKSDVGCIQHLGLRQKLDDLRKAIGRVWCKCVGKHELRFGLHKTWKAEDHVRFDMLMNMPKGQKMWHWGESKVNVHLQE